MSSSSSTSSGIGVIGLLGVAFVVLKLCHQIDWSWWWVLLPFWGGFVIIAIGLALWLLGYLVAAWLDYRRLKNRQRAARAQAEKERAK